MQVALNPHLVYNPFARVTAKSPLWYYNVTFILRSEATPVLSPLPFVLGPKDQGLRTGLRSLRMTFWGE